MDKWTRERLLAVLETLSGAADGYDTSPMAPDTRRLYAVSEDSELKRHFGTHYVGVRYALDDARPSIDVRTLREARECLRQLRREDEL